MDKTELETIHEQIRNRWCACGSKLPRRPLCSSRGIFCGYVCNKCETAKRATFRPEIFTDGQYQADEAIEPEDY